MREAFFFLPFQQKIFAPQLWCMSSLGTYSRKRESLWHTILYTNLWRRKKLLSFMELQKKHQLYRWIARLMIHWESFWVIPDVSGDRRILVLIHIMISVFQSLMLSQSQWKSHGEICSIPSASHNYRLITLIHKEICYLTILTSIIIIFQLFAHMHIIFMFHATLSNFYHHREIFLAMEINQLCDIINFPSVSFVHAFDAFERFAKLKNIAYH